MPDEIPSEIPYAARVVPVSDRWELIQGVRHEFAAELDRMADEILGDGSRRLRSISRWFKGPAEYEDALKRPDVMAICLPLLKSESADPISPAELAEGARSGFCSIGRSASAGRQVLRIMAYPIVILMIAALLGIGFSFWIAPPFEEMYAEFGIDLPSITDTVLASGRLIRQWFWLLLAVPVGLAMMTWVLTRTSGGQSSWLDRRLMTTRSALAAWAWHLSVLLDAGLSQTEALKNAGIAAGKGWLRESSLGWANSPGHEEDPSEQIYFMNPRFRLLNRAMQLPLSAGKITLLRETATYYQDRNRTIGDWWVHWLATLMLCAIAAGVFLIVFSMFTPLLAIISGLTSHK